MAPKSLVRILALLSLAVPCASATTVDRTLDSDHDGLSDSLEQSLLERFTPVFMIAADDCSAQPASFLPGQPTPTVLHEDGTIYGQAFPIHASAAASPRIELHFYHLWRIDCGRDGHALDAEHVSVLLEADPANAQSPAAWHARLWYAAAHEDTVCDASQITRATTLHAEEHGATVWISPGKHASFLAEPLCHGGCGGDHCARSIPLAVAGVINLGERDDPMHGSVWLGSPRWPLAAKMIRSDFRDGPVARLDRLPTTDIAWVSPGKHPAQGTIAVSGATADALGHSGHNTDVALSLSADATGNALDKSYGNVRHALATSAHHVGKFIRGDHSADPAPASPK